MIELTKAQAIEILKSLSRLEGALIAGKASSDVLELLSSPVQILTEKILKEGGAE